MQRLESLFRPERIVHRSNSFVGQIEASAAGIGLGVHDCVLADPDPRLTRILNSAINYPIEVWLVTHEDMRKSPRIRVVFDYLEACFAEDKDRLAGGKA